MAAEIRALSGVRGVAALVIVVYHFGKFHIDRTSGHMVWAVPHGYLPVDMFFMLSGFVMGYTYKDAFVSAPWENYKTFLIKRFARLYPAYWVIGALYALKMAAGLTGEETFARFDAWDAVGNFLMLVGSVDWRVVGVKRRTGILLRAAGRDEKYLAKRNRLVGGLRGLVVCRDLSGQHQRQGLKRPAGCRSGRLFAAAAAGARGFHARIGDLPVRGISRPVVRHRARRSRGRHPDRDCRGGGLHHR
jgi:Acyltransferase family